MNELGNTPADKNYKPSGISRAEEAALKAYPNVLFPFTPLDLNAYRRGAFINGYEQAEKDLALTWEDIRIITKILEDITDEDILVEFYNGDAISCYKEVLRRFKEVKK